MAGEPADPTLDVRITSPISGQVLDGPGPRITVTGTARVSGRDDHAIRWVDVQFGADGPARRASGTTSWTFTGDVAGNGVLRIYATATGAGGLENTASVVVTCALTDTTPPSITITAPAAGARVSGDGTALRVPVTVGVTDDFLGIAAITWSVDGFGRAHESFATPPRSWAGTRTVELDASTRATQTITVSAIDTAGNTASQDVTVAVDDVTAPVVRIVQPPDGARLPPGALGQIALRGVATDQESGVAAVEVALDGGAFAPVTEPPDWDGWWQTTLAAAPGKHTAAVRCADKAGNTRTVTVAFEVARPYRPADPLDLFSRRAYLEDLLWFVSTHLLDGAGQPVTPTTLTEVFRQPFALLADPLQTTAVAPVNQVRVAVEVLRRFVASPEAGLAARFRFDEGAGPTAADSSTGGLDATVLGAAWADGRDGSPALLFDGAAAAVRVPATARLSAITNASTIAFWAFPLSPRQTDTPADGGTSGSSGQRYAFGPQQAGAAFGSADHAGIGISVGTNGVSVYEHSDGYLPASLVHDTPLTGWTHIAVVHEWQPQDFMAGTPAGWYPALYLDGARVASGRASPKPFLHCVPADLGAAGSGYGAFHGRLADIRIYNRSLHAGQVLALATGWESRVAAEYAFLAYGMMLNRVGTSYDELRLARGNDAGARRALAERLGFDLGPARPDELDRLLVTPAQATESVLEDLFGLADTARDPFSAVAPPLLARWREARQRRLWAAADHPAPPRATTPLVVDPDLLVAADLRNRVAGDPAFDLWTARRQWVDATFAAVRASRAALGGAAPANVFDTVVADVVGAPLSELTELDQRRRRASSIDAELDALHLLPAELARLVRLREMAATGIVTDDEWQELYHLLTQVRKRQRRADWLAAEAAIALTPEHFVLSTGPWSPVAWRASAVERADWLDRLQARMDQESAVREALRTAVGEVEQAALPRCRDGLISLLGTTGPAEEADRLTELLLVDFSGGGTELTTRVDQAIETVQLVFLGLRSGRLPPAHPALAWTIEPGGAASFDEEWAWMGGYDSWRAALFLFTYPQDLLAPSVRDTSAAVPETARPTPPFRELVSALRGQQRPRRDIVLIAANEFLTTIRPMLVNFPIRPLPYTAGDEGLRDGLLAFGYTDRPTAADLARIRDLSARVLITLAVGHPGLPNYLQELFYYVPLLVAQNLQRGGDYVAALDWYRTIYAFDQTDLPDFFVPSDERKIYYGLQQEGNAPDVLSRGIHWLRDEVNPHTLAGQRSNPYTRYTFTSIARCFLEYGDSEFTRDTGESRARARSLYLTARSLLRAPELANLAGPGLGVAVPSPVLTALLTRVDNQLRKLRQGRNIAGLRRPVEPPDTAASTSAGMPYIGAGGQLVIPALNPPRPTPYHFTVLLERARQLAATAAQVEASYLSALEKRDAEAYGRLTAGLDLDVARAGEALQSLRVSEAQKGTELARRQKAASDVRATTFQQWIDDGPNEWERSLVRDYDEARVYRDWMVGLDAAITAAQAVASVSSIPGAAAASTVGGLAVGRAVNATSLNRTEQDIALNTLRASQERRQDEWELQLATATQDGLVAQEAILLALDHEAIVGQEARIAGLQAFEAQSVTDFLTRKFTSAELYEWMSGVLGNVYGYFLQQATGTALLAQSQLSFERQQASPNYVQNDYWTPAEDTATVPRPVGGGAPAGAASVPDRRGLTGSARLLQDIEQLAQFAIDNDRRKLNLSQTFSLADLAPFEFQRFRETGVLTFATPMSLFDRSFPGHYLRLIKRVRTSLIALVPPVTGIRATLTASGVSRVVTGPDSFEEVTVRRDPESVALTSPVGASGVFDLDQQSDMLLPFESMGVATTWEFQLPKAANAFDYRSIADLLLTVEYTALNNADLRARVIARLNPRVSGDRAYSLREHFPDAWYDLNNSELSATPMTVRFVTRRDDFPPNLESGSLSVGHLLLYISQRPATAAPVLVRRFALTPTGDTEPLPGSGETAAQSTAEGLISTRAGNWNWLGGAASPVPVAGTWELTFASDVAERFTRGEIEDVLFVITYWARTPPWPDA